MSETVPVQLLPKVGSQWQNKTDPNMKGTVLIVKNGDESTKYVHLEIKQRIVMPSGNFFNLWKPDVEQVMASIPPKKVSSIPTSDDDILPDSVWEKDGRFYQVVDRKHRHHDGVDEVIAVSLQEIPTDFIPARFLVETYRKVSDVPLEA